MKRLADKILEIHKKRQATPESSKKEMLDREVRVYEEKIDSIIYELYGLTAQERQLVDGQTR